MGGEKKPKNTAIKQQRLYAWLPLVTPKTAISTFFIVGIIFIPLGIALHVSSHNIREIELDYTNCNNAPSEFTTKDVPVNIYQWKFSNDICTIQFKLSSEIRYPVYIYYYLTNYYQNHRRYVKSYSGNQLKGEVLPPTQLSSCAPYASLPSDPTIPIYPCGLIANSLFNDTVINITTIGTYVALWKFSEKGISWEHDKNRYVNARSKYLAGFSPGQTLTNVVPPPNWSKYNGTYTYENFPDLSSDEHFQVWMRTAGLSSFRKLYGKSETTLTTGTWQIAIKSIYPVKEFKGTKSIIISTTSWAGGQNYFLSILYLCLGSIFLVFAISFLVLQIINPRKLGDHSAVKSKS